MRMIYLQLQDFRLDGLDVAGSIIRLMKIILNVLTNATSCCLVCLFNAIELQFVHMRHVAAAKGGVI